MFVASCVANFENKFLAVWTAKEPITKPKLTFSDDNAPHKLSFKLREGTPVLSGCHATIYFPDTHLKIHDATKAVFISNRDRAYCDYQLDTKAGEKLYFGGGTYSITKSSNFEMGGPLTAKMFAGFIWSENGSAWDAGSLHTNVELVDTDGLLFDRGRSKASFRTELFFAPDEKTPEPLEGHKPGSKGFKPNSILAKVHYTYGGRGVTSECRGEDLVRVHSDHFSLGTPPMWMFKARQFLSCLEAIRKLTIKNTGRRGPASSKVDWRSNGDNAKSIVGSAQGGGHDLWMSFPWWTFDSFWDPFTEPWFAKHDPYVCHEVLHSFGYNHGDEMSKLEWRAEEQYRSLRWRSVDTGEWQVWQISLKGEKKYSSRGPE
jgi:hypothetical protein